MNRFVILNISIILLVLFAWGCEKKEIPVVTTTPATDVTESSAMTGGEIVSNGGASIKSHGICWSTSPNPTTSGNKTDLGKSSGGSFTSSITGLMHSTTYYVRAYATNKVGTAYGNEVAISTRLSDKDGNVYSTVQIGNQLWMAENLKTTKYSNGSSIPYPGSDANIWYGSTTGGYAWYDNDELNKDAYGAIYNWHAVQNSADVCPTGWRVPTDEDWTTLVTFLGGESVAGSKLKETGNTYWEQPNSDATNESGFRARPGGSRSEQGTYGSKGYTGFFWSSTQFNLGNGWARSLGANNGNVLRFYATKSTGHSVRCIKE